MAEVDLLIKLFDTLKDSSKDILQTCQAMLTNQTNIGNYIQNMPLDELKQTLKDHSKDSTDEIGTCTETVESTTDILLKEVQKLNVNMSNLKNRFSKMIWIIAITFSLIAASYLFVRTVVDTDESHKQLKKEIIKELNLKN